MPGNSNPSFGGPVTNVFAVHTPFQRFAAEWMLKTCPDFRAAPNRALAIGRTPASLGIDTTVWSDVIELPADVMQSFTIPRMKLAWNWARQCTEDLEATGRINLCVSNIDLLVPNALVALARLNPARRLLSVYPEGLGTLFPPRLRPLKHCKNLVKTSLGFARGAPYRYYGNDFNGMRAADVIYSFVPGTPSDFTPKVRQLYPPARRTKDLVEGAIVLGDSNAFIPEEENRRLLAGLINFVKSNTSGSLMYKPHHHASGRDIEDFVRAGFQLISDARPVEEIFITRPVRKVVSVISSALLHLKVFYGADISCTAYKMKTAYSYSYDNGPHRYNAIRSAFRRFGVEMIDD